MSGGEAFVLLSTHASLKIRVMTKSFHIDGLLIKAAKRTENVAPLSGR